MLPVLVLLVHAVAEQRGMTIIPARRNRQRQSSRQQYEELVPSSRRGRARSITRTGWFRPAGVLRPLARPMSTRRIMILLDLPPRLWRMCKTMLLLLLPPHRLRRRRRWLRKLPRRGATPAPTEADRGGIPCRQRRSSTMTMIVRRRMTMLSEIAGWQDLQRQLLPRELRP